MHIRSGSLIIPTHCEVNCCQLAWINLALGFVRVYGACHHDLMTSSSTYCNRDQLRRDQLQRFEIVPKAVCQIVTSNLPMTIWLFSLVVGLVESLVKEPAFRDCIISATIIS